MLKKKGYVQFTYDILSFWNGKSTSMISLILKCDYENTLNFWSKYEPKYGNGWIRGGKVWPNVSFDTQIVDGTLKGNWCGKVTQWMKMKLLGKKTKKTPRLCELLEVHPSIVQLCWFHPFQKLSQLHFHPFSKFPPTLETHFTQVGNWGYMTNIEDEQAMKSISIIFNPQSFHSKDQSSSNAQYLFLSNTLYEFYPFFN